MRQTGEGHIHMTLEQKLTLVIAAAAVASACGTIYYAAIAHREHAAGRQIFIF
jgi:hypothetical protein